MDSDMDVPWLSLWSCLSQRPVHCSGSGAFTHSTSRAVIPQGWASLLPELLIDTVVLSSSVHLLNWFRHTCDRIPIFSFIYDQNLLMLERSTLRLLLVPTLPSAFFLLRSLCWQEGLLFPQLCTCLWQYFRILGSKRDWNSDLGCIFYEWHLNMFLGRSKTPSCIKGTGGWCQSAVRQRWEHSHPPQSHREAVCGLELGAQTPRVFSLVGTCVLQVEIIPLSEPCIFWSVEGGPEY